MPLHTKWSNFRSSFQFRLFLIFTLLTFFISCLLSTLFVIYQIRETKQQTTERLKLRALHLGDLIRLPLYAENLPVLRQLAEKAAEAPEIRAVVISAPDGRVLADVHVPFMDGETEVISQTVEIQSNGIVNSLESTITGGTDITTGSLIGTVRIERGMADFSRTLQHIVILSTSIAIAFWLAVSLLCYLVLRRVTRSFNALISGINSLHNGNFSSRIEIIAKDEPGRAAEAINNLADQLELREVENKRLHEERMELERQMLQAQKLESLGIMAGGIAHDFNNLLQAILGNIELAAMLLEKESAPQKYITNAINSGTRAAHLTDLMLTYTGKRFIAKKSINLNELVRENAEMLQTAATTSVEFKLHLSPELPLILADEGNLQQVVMNLITNASESITTLPGIIKLTSGVQHCDQTCLCDSLLDVKPDPGNFVFLEVSDNGCGMDEETLKRIFDPFFTTKFTGRGLGMSAIMGIMKSHNGAFFVKSEPGIGTTFRALFPIIESAQLPPPTPFKNQPETNFLLKSQGIVEQGEAINSPENSVAPEKPLSGVALVADDEKSVLSICKKMVELSGFKVITACDGVEAVAKFREHAAEITLVLLDLTMPNMDGIIAMGEIYRIRPDAKVILASGFNQDDLSEQLTGLKPSGFIRKPYNMSALKAELQRVFRGHNTNIPLTLLAVAFTISPWLVFPA